MDWLTLQLFFWFPCHDCLFLLVFTARLSIFFLFSLKYSSFYVFILCVWGMAHLCHSLHVEVRWQLASLLPLCRDEGSNSGHQVYRQASLPLSYLLLAWGFVFQKHNEFLDGIIRKSKKNIIFSLFIHHSASPWKLVYTCGENVS